MIALATVVVTIVVLAALPLPYAVGNPPSLRRAPVTALLVAINVVVFLASHVSLTRGLVEPLQAFNDYGLTPADVHPRDLITYAFLHISGAHLLWNMAFLYLFGPPVEERVGSLLYAALYLLGGAAAGLINSAIVMHVAGNSSAAYLPVVGASGAISAVLGLFAVYATRRPLKLFWAMGYLTGRERHLLQIPAIYGIALWLAQTVYGAALSLVNNDATGVAYFTHIGGFIAGVALGAIAKHARRVDPQETITERRGGDALQERIVRSDRTIKTNAEQLSTSSGLIDLLGRALDDCDIPRAEALLAKCRAMGLALPTPLLDRLESLNASCGPTADGNGVSGDTMLPDKK